jgi:hypothetical protein
MLRPNNHFPDDQNSVKMIRHDRVFTGTAPEIRRDPRRASSK